MDTQKLSFAFWGTPDVAADTLDILFTQGYIPSVIITAPDRPQGRGLTLTPPPVKAWALAHNVPFLQPEKLTGEFLSELSTFDFQLSIVVAYGKILSQQIIDLPPKGTINIHYSLLPKYRGASPVESAVLHGDTETGIAIQQMALGLDTGDILVEEKVSIDPEETAPALRKRLIKIGAELLVKNLPDIIAGSIVPQQQSTSGISTCGKIKKEDGLINLSDDAQKNYNKYRAYYGWPGIFFFVGSPEDGKYGKRIKITEAVFENNTFTPTKVIPEGKKEILFEEFKKQSL